MSIQEHNITSDLRQQIVDEEHLKLLRIGYFVSAAMTGFVSLFGLLYAFIGFFVLASNPALAGPDSPAFVGWVMGVLGLCFGVGAVALTAAKIYTGQCLKQRRARIFCLVTAAITTLGIPEGSLLGIWTFMVLNRPSVSRMFDAK